ncbi:LPS export ABC transporter periplasmic protein LptC, partial [Dokdonella sp.]|uniref:LPS export ABC transporter periplasmic protein LptC n=1 Tax=Dokdonella sp. TaxID=2291710 RepID=UPI003C3CD96B
NQDGSLMELEGNVVMDRVTSESVEPATLSTSNLTAMPKAKKLETAAPAQISQPGSILRGTGLRGDLNTKVLELLSDVHNTFEPKAK